MENNSAKWKGEIFRKLESVYDADALVKLMFFLDSNNQKEGQEHGEDYVSPFWRTLQLASEGQKVLKAYADRLLKDVEDCEQNPKFYAAMRRIYEEMADSKCRTAPPPGALKQANTSISGMALGAATGVLKTWECLTPVAQTQVLNFVKKAISTQQAIQCVDEVVSLVNTSGGSVVMVGLAALSIGWEAYRNIRRWWKGEISGKRCSKNIIDTLAEVVAGVGGGLGGATIGSMLLPGVGTLIGGLAGGILSSLAAKALFDRITTKLFDLPKTEALENAYKFLGVHHSASNHELNKAFRAMALKYHPDKGGKAEQFHELQINFGVIKASKGESV